MPRASRRSAVPRLPAILRRILRLGGLGGVPLLLLPLLPLAVSGCEAIAAVGAKTNYTVLVPSYVGFKGQSVAVMAWADNAYRWEDNALVLDVMQGVSGKLQGAQRRGAEELKGTTFPRTAAPDAVFKFQTNHPETASQPVTEVAPQLGVSRLIYIEIEDFDRHAGAVVELSRGHLSGTLKVVEVSGKNAKIAYTDRVEVTWPKQSPEEGLPGLEDRDVYLGTLDAFCTAVVEKFVAHPAP